MLDEKKYIYILKINHTLTYSFEYLSELLHFVFNSLNSEDENNKYEIYKKEVDNNGKKENV